MKPLILKICDAIIYDKNCKQSDHTIAKQLGMAKQLFIKYLKTFMKLALPYQKKDELAAHHSLTHQVNKSLKLLFKKMLKIIGFV